MLQMVSGQAGTTFITIGVFSEEGEEAISSINLASKYSLAVLSLAMLLLSSTNSGFFPMLPFDKRRFSNFTALVANLFLTLMVSMTMFLTLLVLMLMFLTLSCILL